MTKILLTLAIFFSSLSLAHCQNAEASTEYEYVTITTDRRSPQDIYISNSNGDYEVIEVDADGIFNYSKLLQIVIEKEEQGYELFANNISTFAGHEMDVHNYFLLRRKKN